MTTKGNEPWIFKYIVIGDQGVGKSSILRQFNEKQFSLDLPHTIGVEFLIKLIEIGGRRIKLQLWDTAGQEKFRAVTKSYYRNSLAVFLVYDITRRETFTHLGTWLNDCKSLISSSTLIVLIGNKLDLNDERTVSFEEATKFSEENKLFYLETSAKTGKNVEDAFYQSANKIFELVKNGSIPKESVAPEPLAEESKKDESGCSC